MFYSAPDRIDSPPSMARRFGNKRGQSPFIHFVRPAAVTTGTGNAKRRSVSQAVPELADFRGKLLPARRRTDVINCVTQNSDISLVVAGESARDDSCMHWRNADLPTWTQQLP